MCLECQKFKSMNGGVEEWILRKAEWRILDQASTPPWTERPCLVHPRLSDLVNLPANQGAVVDVKTGQSCAAP